MQVRYDEEKGIYRDCKWCGGKGCVCCPGEADKEYKRQFPNGPEPIATFHLDNPDEVKKLEEVFGRESIEKAFGNNGGGVNELIRKLQNI